MARLDVESGLMGDSLDVARRILERSNWRPIREIGRGGGGAVYLCANMRLVKLFDAFGDRIQNLAIRRHAGSGISEALPEFTVESLVEGLVASARAGDGVAAVKIPHAESGEAVERFRREVEAMRRFVHPALIRLIDSDPASPPRWFAMEAHAGGTLADERHRAKYRGRPI